MNFGETWSVVLWELSGELNEDMWETIRLQEVYDNYNNVQNIEVHEKIASCCLGGGYFDVKFFIVLFLVTLLLIYLYVLLILFCFYRCKKQKHPFKQALKKSWLWGIVVSIVVLCLLFLFWNIFA